MDGRRVGPIVGVAAATAFPFMLNAERLKARLSRALNLVWLVGFG